jgi:hypothetical protein
LAAFIIVIILTVFVIVYVQEGERRIPVQYGKRVRGRRVFGGGSTFIPLKVNMSGMIPLIFAQSLLVLPAIIFQILAGSPNPDVAAFFNNLAQAFSGGQHSLAFLYWIMMFLLVVGFTFFYTDVLMQQQIWPTPCRSRAVYSRHSTRPAHERVHHGGVAPHHAGGCVVSGWHRRAAVLPDGAGHHPECHEHVDSEHRYADRGGRSIGYDPAVGGAVNHAPLRGFSQVARSIMRPPTAVVVDYNERGTEQEMRWQNISCCLARRELAKARRPSS